MAGSAPEHRRLCNRKGQKGQSQRLRSRRNLPGKEEVRRLETQLASLKALPRSPLAVRVGGDSQDSGKRKLLQAGSWDWGWKCQAASQVAMATETKRVAEEWLGMGIPKRGPGSPYWTGAQSCW